MKFKLTLGQFLDYATEVALKPSGKFLTDFFIHRSPCGVEWAKVEVGFPD